MNLVKGLVGKNLGIKNFVWVFVLGGWGDGMGVRRGGGGRGIMG